jgi:hypothetical protein
LALRRENGYNPDLAMSAEAAEDRAKDAGRPFRRLWVRAWSLAAGLVVFGSLYFFVRQYFKDGVWAFDPTLVDKSLGVASLVLLSVSMLLTSVAYFKGGSAKPLVFRKHYGLVGFWIGLTHAGVNHFLLPLWGFHSERPVEAWISDAPAIAALALFGAMAFLSLPKAKARLGGPMWRRTLRYAGYAGLALSIGHASLLKWASWTNYFRTFGSVVPSLSLPAALFAAAAVVLRLAVWVSGRRRRA